jgi:hypothetical protein
MKYFMLVLLTLLTACGFGGKDGKDGDDGYTCTPTVDDSGVLFTCSDGQSYRVDNGTIGPVGPKGEQGPIGPQGLPGKDGIDGKDGQDGKGLTVESTKVCNGEIEGWLENTAYKVEFKSMLFSTGNVLAASKVSLLRADETINSRDAAQFFVDESSEIALNMGVFSVALEGDVLKVTSKGGIKAEISCEVK